MFTTIKDIKAFFRNIDLPSSAQQNTNSSKFPLKTTSNKSDVLPKNKIFLEGKRTSLQILQDLILFF